MKKAGQALVLLASILALKLPWFALQVAAWIGMFASYTHLTSSWQDGLEMTFDREYRCKICKSLDIVHKDATGGQMLSQEMEVKLLVPGKSVILTNNNARAAGVPSAFEKRTTRRRPPPTPPPIFISLS